MLMDHGIWSGVSSFGQWLVCPLWCVIACVLGLRKSDEWGQAPKI